MKKILGMLARGINRIDDAATAIILIVTAIVVVVAVFYVQHDKATVDTARWVNTPAHIVTLPRIVGNHGNKVANVTYRYQGHRLVADAPVSASAVVGETTHVWADRQHGGQPYTRSGSPLALFNETTIFSALGIALVACVVVALLLVVLWSWAERYVNSRPVTDELGPRRKHAA